MNIMIICKRGFFILLLLCVFPFFAPSAKAQLTEDGKVDVVQAHFHFKDASGNGVSHDLLKQVLETPVPTDPQPNNGYAATYLDAGLILANYIDERDKFAQGNYSDYTIDFDRLLVEDLSAWLVLIGIKTWVSATDVYDFIASHGSTFRSQLTKTTEDKSLDIFNAVGKRYPATKDVTEVYGELGSDVYGKFGAVTDGIYAYHDTLAAFKQVTVNNMLAVYIKNCGGTDDESDANAWLVAQVEAGNSLVADDLNRVHLDCRYAYVLKQKLVVIQPSLDQYTSDINALVAGGVKFTYSPDQFSLYAPITVTIDASGSTGAFGNSISSYQWTVDGSPVSAQSKFQATYWAVGQHTVQCTVTDSQSNQITGNDTFFVSPPPISITNFDANNRAATFSTPTNHLLASTGGYAWDFGDGSTPVVRDTADPIPHTFPNNQKYNVTLTETAQTSTTVRATTTVNFTPEPTDVYGGTMTSSQDWGISGSPYRIHGRLIIPAGVRLSLEPGVVLQFDKNVGVDVYGEVISKGQFSPKQRVYLTSYRDNSPPSLPSPGTDEGYAGDWDGLYFFPGSSGTLTACVLREAWTGVAGGIPVIAGATFAECYSGIYPAGTVPLTVTGCTFHNCGLQASADGGINVTGNTFDGDGHAYNYSYSALSLGSSIGADVTVTGNSFTNGASASFGGTFGTLRLSGNQGVDGPIPFNLGGTLTKDNEWAPQQNIHLVVPTGSTMTIGAGSTLRLGSGMTLQFGGRNIAGSGGHSIPGAVLMIDGYLQAEGPAPATLTDTGDDSPYGGQDISSDYYGVTNWGGIQFSLGAVANLQGIVIRHAQIGADGSLLVINGGTFDHDNTGISGSVISVNEGIFEDCGYGIFSDGTSPSTVTDCVFHNCGLFVTSANSLTVTDNSFDGTCYAYNYSYSSLSVSSSSGTDVTATGNSFTSGATASFNGTLGTLRLSGNQGVGGPVPFNLGGTLTKDNEWALEASIRLVVPNATTLTVGQGSTLKLGSGMTIQFGEGYVPDLVGSVIPPATLVVAGNLQSEGPSPALLTAIGDDTPYGGQDNSANSYSYSHWAGIQYPSRTTANLTGMIIRHAYQGVLADTANLNNCTFTQNNTGVLVNNGGGTYRNCSFTQNGMAVQNNSTTNVDARGNYWGDPTGPYNAKSNPGGRGNAISDYVLFGALSPPVLTSLTFPSPVPGGTVVTATVTLSSPALSDVVVGLSSSDSSIVRLHRAVVIPAGSASATFQINTYRSHVTKTVTIQASLDQVIKAQGLIIAGR